MRIVHIVEAFGGGVFDFLRILTSNIDAEHIIVHSLRKETPKNYKKFFEKNIKFFYWKSANREINLSKDFRALLDLIFILRSLSQNKKIDVIHLHSSKAGFLGRLAAKTLGLSDKVIYTTHGISFLRKDISLTKKKILISLEKLAYKLGGKVIACSRSEAEFIKKYGIEASYIFNGLKCPKLGNKKFKANKFIETEKIKIATVGRITFPKNPFLFREIAKAFLSVKNVEFIWIGDGELKNVIDLPNIKITGWLSQEEVFEVLKQADIYLSTSLWEGLPLAVLQAMCTELPLVLHHCVGNIDLVEEEYNGFLFRNKVEAVEKLKLLINFIEKRISMGKASLKLVQTKFSLEKMIAEYRNLYESI